jgi:kynurenine formamidase
MDADYKLSKQDVLNWEDANGPIPAGSVVIMYTGWCKKWQDYDAYKNQDKNGNMHFPGFSESAVRFLVEERTINGIGIDTFSVDAGNTEGFPVHSVINGAGKFSLENMANVHLLPTTGMYLTVSPIKILGGSGGQVRIFAIVD